MKSLAHVYTRIFDAPLAIHPAKFDAIVGGIADRLGLEPTAEQIEAAAQSVKSQGKGYSMQDGIAIIPVQDSLMKRASGMAAMSGGTTYEAIGAQFKDAMQSVSVKGILLCCDSPGGETSGLFELADLIQSFKGQKPVYAISDDSAFSAAYAIACTADKLFVTRTAGVGSIGVFCCHVDQSAADAKAGLKYTFIHAGDKKTDGNSHEPLSESALNDTQAEVNRQYGMFVSLVAKSRKASEEAIRATEAGVYFGENAVPLLADKVGTYEDALAELISKAETPQIITRSVSLNNSATKLKTHTKLEETEPMAKKNTEPTIDDLVAKFAEKEAKDEECADEYMEKPPMDDDDEEDEEDDDKKDKDAKAEAKAAPAVDGRADAVRIVNLCKLAGMSDLASDFLVNGYTVAQVESALLKHRAGKSKKVKVASSNTAAPGADVRTAAAAIMTDESIPAEKKADAYRKFLLKNQRGYLETMLNRESSDHPQFYKQLLKTVGVN